MADLEVEVLAWVQIVTGEKHAGQHLADWLHDGQVLCRLANIIQPGICPHINSQAMPFKQMENVTAFIQACRKLGVLEKDVFSTVDLYEQKNLKAVCLCIYNLGSVVRTTAPSFKGPYLGVEQTAAVSDFARKKQSVTQNMGYRQDIDVEVRAGVRKSRIAGVDPGAPPEQRPPASPRPAPPQPASPRPALPGAVAPRPAPPAVGSGAQTAPGSAADAAAPDARSRPAGPSAPPELEAEVRGWLEEVSRRRSAGANLGDWLHDGRILCTVANALQPEICPRINTADSPFKQMENITAFIQASRKLGVLEKDVFSTVDLYEQKNMKAVCQCIYSLASVARTTAPVFKGPYLGVAQSAAVSDTARKKSVVTQDMGYRKDIDAEVKAGVQMGRVAGQEPRKSAPGMPRDAADAGAGRKSHLAPPDRAEQRPSPAASASPLPAPAQPSPAGPPKARLTGPLLKLSPHFMTGWQLRWFEIGAGCMRYWTSPADASAGKAPKGEISLLGLKVQIQSGMKFDVSTASSGDRTFFLDSDVGKKLSGTDWSTGPKSLLSAKDWVQALEQEAVMARRRDA